MKQRITISIDVAQYEYHGLGARNASEYINQLLIDKTRVDNYQALYEKTREQLIKDPVFIAGLSGRPSNDFSEPEDYA